MTILVNLSTEDDVLDTIANDEAFLDLVISKILVCALHPVAASSHSTATDTAAVPH